MLATTCADLSSNWIHFCAGIITVDAYILWIQRSIVCLYLAVWGNAAWEARTIKREVMEPGLRGTRCKGQEKKSAGQALF